MRGRGDHAGGVGARFTLSEAQISRILAGLESLSLHAIAALSVALGARPVVRIQPVTGPRIRDRIQALIVEALIRILHARWKRFIEVPVYRPVRGVIDSVLHDPAAGVALAAEIHSQIRRFEQQQRWANAKADALIDGSELPLALVTGERPAISRLLVLLDAGQSRSGAHASGNVPNGVSGQNGGCVPGADNVGRPMARPEPRLGPRRRSHRGDSAGAAARSPRRTLTATSDGDGDWRATATAACRRPPKTLC